MTTSNTGAEQLAPDRHMFFWAAHVSVLYSIHMRKALRAQKVNLTIWRILAVLRELGSATVTDLASATVVERTALTRTITQMERDGLLAREPDSIDRRRARIAITGKGIVLHKKIVPIFEAVQLRALGDITPARAHALVSTLRLLAQNLEGYPYDPLVRRHDLSDGRHEKSKKRNAKRMR